MTRLGRRFLEKGRRSGSCFEAQSSMVVSSTSRWRGATAMEGALNTNARGVWCSRCSSSSLLRRSLTLGKAAGSTFQATLPERRARAKQGERRKEKGERGKERNCLCKKQEQAKGWAKRMIWGWPREKGGYRSDYAVSSPDQRPDAGLGVTVEVVSSEKSFRAACCM